MAQNVYLCLGILLRAGYWIVEFKYNVFCVLQTLPSEFLCNHKTPHCQTKNCLVTRQRSSLDQNCWFKRLLGLKFQARTAKNLNRLHYLVILRMIYVFIQLWHLGYLSEAECSAEKLVMRDSPHPLCPKQNSSTCFSLDVTTLCQDDPFRATVGV